MLISNQCWSLIDSSKFTLAPQQQLHRSIIVFRLNFHYSSYIYCIFLSIIGGAYSLDGFMRNSCSILVTTFLIKFQRFVWDFQLLYSRDDGWSLGSGIMTVNIHVLFYLVSQNHEPVLDRAMELQELTYKLCLESYICLERLDKKMYPSVKITIAYQLSLARKMIARHILRGFYYS